MMRGDAQVAGKRRKRWGWAILMAGAFLGGLGLMGIALFWPATGSRPAPGASAFASPASPVPPGTADNAVKESGPRMAIIVDDMGYEPVRDAEWLDFPEKISVSVLPFGPSSHTVAASASSKGYCVLLHVPMEPESPSVDGTEPYRLRRGMTAKEIEDLVVRMAQDIPQATGASNHMGSAFTADEAAMGAFAAALKGRGLFFVDAATTGGSLGMDAARRAGVPAVRRDVFLDDDPSPEAMRRQWERAIALAKKRGEAVLVCHPRRETLKAMREMLPDLKKEGIRPVTIQEMLAAPANG
jgi:polysaccharide deacetylase 2 family uncharacterized protein YibQ